MDDRLNSLKEKQQEISDKISLLQETNKRKDEEAAEISKLIAECRENLNRIKGISPDYEPVLAPCSEVMTDKLGLGGSTGSRRNSKRSEGSQGEGGREDGSFKGDGSSKRSRAMSGSAKDVSQGDKSSSRKGSQSGRGSSPFSRTDTTSNKGNAADTFNDFSGSMGEQKDPCNDSKTLASAKDTKSKKKKKGCDKERVSCKVDLNKMKVRIRGPSEDLKKLDATQLINLLEKFQCQELVINTGEEVLQDPGEIRLIYMMHPGNLIMLAGILLMAFLMTANVCSEKKSCSTQFLLDTLFVGSFAMHFGMVLWMFFIRGYALRCGLCQDTFHLVDNLVLPKYYSLCVILSALSLYSFMATHCVAPCSAWSLDVIPQLIVVVVTFFMELMTICYIIPAVIKLRDATDDFQMDEEEAECALPDSYEKNLVKLGKLNWTIFLINFLTLMFLGANIYYITSKLRLSS